MKITSERPTVFISAYRNFSMRYILYSDIFGELRKRSFRFVVFVRDNDVDYHRGVLGGENVIVEPVLYDQTMSKARSERLHKFFIVLRKMMHARTRRTVNSTHDILVDQYRREMSGTWKASLAFRGLRLLAGLGSRVGVLRKAIGGLESRLYPGRMYDHYFEKYRPSILVISSLGYMADPYFMRAAKRYECKVVSIPHSWDNTSVKDYRGANPNHVIAWNEIMKREVNVFHDVPEEAIYIGGIAHWDIYFNGAFEPGRRSDFLFANGLLQDRKVLFFGTSSPILFRRTLDVVEGLLDAIEEGRFLDPCQLLVRLHPSYLEKDKRGDGRIIDRFQRRIEALKKRYSGLVSFIPPTVKLLNDDIDIPIEDMLNLARTLHHSDVMLTEYSTLMIEGAIFDLPVVNVGLYSFRDTERPAFFVENFTHIKRVLRTGATREAHTMEELVESINHYLQDPSRDRDRRQQLVAQEVTTNAGCAGRAIAAYISRLAENPVTNAGA